MKQNITLKISLGLVTGLLSLQPLARAADQGTPAGGAGGQRLAQLRERIQERVQELNLTDEQKEALKPLWQEQAQKLRELVRDSSLSREEKIEQSKAAREEMKPKLKQILTSEQFDKLQKQREQMREQIAQRRQARQK